MKCTQNSPSCRMATAPSARELKVSFTPERNIGKPTHNISLPLWGRWIDKAFSRSQDGRGRVLQCFKPLPSLLRKSTLPKGEGFK